MTKVDDVDLEEINKERIALGLKPLTISKTPVESPEKQAESNYSKQREKETQEREKKCVPYSLTYQPTDPPRRRIEDKIAK